MLLCSQNTLSLKCPYLHQWQHIMNAPRNAPALVCHFSWIQRTLWGRTSGIFSEDLHCSWPCQTSWHFCIARLFTLNSMFKEAINVLSPIYTDLWHCLFTRYLLYLIWQHFLPFLQAEENKPLIAIFYDSSKHWRTSHKGNRWFWSVTYILQYLIFVCFLFCFALLNNTCSLF